MLQRKLYGGPSLKRGLRMEIKKTISKFTYRVEEKPEGGFIGRPGDPAMEPIEGATREEVQEKIQARIAELIEEQIPSTFKLGGLNITVNKKIKMTTATSQGSMLTNVQTRRFAESSPVGTAPSPIVPSGGSGTILRVIAVLIAVGALFYFLFLRR